MPGYNYGKGRPYQRDQNWRHVIGKEEQYSFVGIPGNSRAEQLLPCAMNEIFSSRCDTPSPTVSDPSHLHCCRDGAFTHGAIPMPSRVHSSQHSQGSMGSNLPVDNPREMRRIMQRGLPPMQQSPRSLEELSHAYSSHPPSHQSRRSALPQSRPTLMPCASVAHGAAIVKWKPHAVLISRQPDRACGLARSLSVHSGSAAGNR